MADQARSSDPAVQAQLDRLWARGPGADVLGLDRIERLLDALGGPHHRMPPVFHVAGTNGKGSTCAFLRAALEAAGHRVHAYTSPHLVRFNERIRLAGTLIGDAALAPLLAEVNEANEGVGGSFFEVTTAAAFLAFSRVPADACVVEVGLGGRLDATNVIAAPLVTGIARLGMDHEAFLGSTIVAIAREKAGIAKPGVPLVSIAAPRPDAADAMAQVAAAAGAPMVRGGVEWDVADDGANLVLRDPAGRLALPYPALPGAHQFENLGLAAAMLRAQERLAVPDSAIVEAARRARWPARMQLLGAGPLTARATGRAIWLDGGHNQLAGAAIAGALDRMEAGPVDVVIGMLANKDAAGLLAPLAAHAASLVAVPVPGHDHHPPESIASTALALGIGSTATAVDPAAALDRIAGRDGPARPVLILGSLYLAGSVLAANGEPPD